MCLWQTYMMTHGTPTATKRKSDSQYPRHGDARNKSRLFYIPRGISGQGGLIGHAVALPRDKQSPRIALPRTGEERDLVLPLMDTQRFRVGRRDDAFAGDSIGERVTHDLDIERVAVFEFTEPGEQGRAFQIRMTGDYGARILATDRQTGARQMAGRMFEHILTSSVEDGHVDADLRNQNLTHGIQPIHGQLTPVFGIALEIALGLPVEHRFAYLWLTAFIKTLIICDGRLDDALTGGFRKQRGRLADGSRLLVNGAVAERLLDAGHGDKHHARDQADDCGDRVDPGMADEPAGAIVARPLVADRIRDALPHVGFGRCRHFACFPPVIGMCLPVRLVAAMRMRSIGIITPSAISMSANPAYSQMVGTWA